MWAPGAGPVPPLLTLGSGCGPHGPGPRPYLGQIDPGGARTRVPLISCPRGGPARFAAGGGGGGQGWVSSWPLPRRRHLPWVRQAHSAAVTDSTSGAHRLSGEQGLAPAPARQGAGCSGPGPRGGALASEKPDCPLPTSSCQGLKPLPAPGTETQHPRGLQGGRVGLGAQAGVPPPQNTNVCSASNWPRTPGQMKWPEGRKWGDSGSVTSGTALPAGDVGHVPQPPSAPHQIDRLSLVPHHPWVFGVSGCSWPGRPGAGVGWSSGALAHPGLPAWLWLSQETGSLRGLQIAPYKLSASWAATRHKYSLSLRLRWARPTSPPRAWGPRLPAPARLRAQRAPGPLPGQVSRVRVPHAVPDQEAEACAPSQHCRSLPSGPLWAELGLLPAKACSPPFGVWGPAAMVRNGGGRG